MQSPIPSPSLTPSALETRRWLFLAIATSQQAGLTFVRFGVPTLAPFLRTDLDLSLAQVGLVLGAFDLGALLAFYLTGMATGRYGVRNVMAVGALATGLIAATATLAPRLAWVVALLALAGMGFPSSQVTGSQAVMGWFPVQERGIAMGVRQAGLPIGGLAAALILPWVAAVAGWRMALLVAAAGCALAGILPLIGLPRDAGRSQGPDADRVTPGLQALLEAPRRFAHHPALLTATLMACLLGASQFALLGYLPLYMIDGFAWDGASAARLLLLVHIGGVAGRMGWGWVSDKRFGGNRPRPLALVALCSGVVAGLVGLLSLWTSLPLIIAGAVALAAGLTMMGWNALYITLISELGGRDSAVMLGLSMTILFCFTMLAPPAFGWLVESMGTYTSAWAILAGVNLTAALAAIVTGRKMARAG